MHIVCSHCWRVNRIEQPRLDNTAVCGACGRSLLNPEPIALDTNSFVRFIGRNDLPVAVDFWAPWCGPCQAMAPQVSAAAQHLQGRVLFAKLDTDAHSELATQFAIRSIPTLALFRGGSEVGRHSGLMSAKEIEQWIAHAVPSAAA